MVKVLAWIIIYIYVLLIAYIVLYKIIAIKIKGCKLNKMIDKYYKDIYKELEKSNKLKDIYNFNDSKLHKNTEISIDKCNMYRYTELFRDIEDAKDSIYIQYIKINNDRIGKEFINLLDKKSEEGVKVKVIYDSMESYKMHSSFFYNNIKNKSKTIKYRISFISNLFRKYKKMIIIDENIGYVGEIIIGNKNMGIYIKNR